MFGIFYPGQVVEGGHPNICPLDHEGWIEQHGPKIIKRVVEVINHNGHESLVFPDDPRMCWCAGTFRPIEPADDDIFSLGKKKEPVHGG